MAGILIPGLVGVAIGYAFKEPVSRGVRVVSKGTSTVVGGGVRVLGSGVRAVGHVAGSGVRTARDVTGIVTRQLGLSKPAPAPKAKRAAPARKRATASKRA